MNAFIQFGRNQISCWAITVPEGRVLRKVTVEPYVALSRRACRQSIFSDSKCFIPAMKPIAYGKAALQYPMDQTADPFCCAPFSNDHISVSHSEGAIHLFQYVVKLASEGDFTARIVRPRIILYPVDAKGRGLTDFESNSLMHLAAEAGACQADIANPEIDFTEMVLHKIFTEGIRSTPQSPSIQMRKAVMMIVIAAIIALYLIMKLF